MNSNFSLIKPLLVFDSEDDFYFLQIIKRKKENPELGRNSSTIKNYYINSVLYFEEKKEEIIELCNNHNVRAYINLNPRSYEKCARVFILRLCGIRRTSCQPAPMSNSSTKLELTTSSRMTQSECYKLGGLISKNLNRKIK